MAEYVDFAVWLGVIGLLFSFGLFTYVRKQPVGTETMAELAEAIQSGAMTFLKREYTVLLPFIGIVMGLLFWLVSLHTAIAYILGAFCSILAGFVGMQAATAANVRTSEAARSSGQAKALRVAFSGGAVMGTAVASLGLIGIGAVLMMYDPQVLGFRPFGEIISGFAMGASSIALFARVGGGIYTKAADVGADLVGKVEAGIPEDAPYICFLARDSSYLNTSFPNQNSDGHNCRDTSIHSHVPAAQEMTRRGYFAVRMGAIVKERLETSNPMIVDYATKHRTDFMDIYLASKCRFFIGDPTGFTCIPWLFRRPSVNVNFIPVEFMHSWDPNLIGIPKKLWLRNERRLMTFPEAIELSSLYKEPGKKWAGINAKEGKVSDMFFPASALNF